MDLVCEEGMIKITKQTKSSVRKVGGTSKSPPIQVSGLSALEDEGGFTSFGARNVKNLSQKIRTQVLARMRGALAVVHEEILRRTPVHSGGTIANYVWSIGAPIVQDLPFSGGFEEKTFDLALGSERNRPAAEMMANSSFQRMMNKLRSFDKVFLTNGTTYEDGSNFLDLEYGKLPGQNLGTRVPSGGIIRFANKKAETYLRRNK